MAIATIDDKWRVTIPKEARKAMRLSPRVPVSMKLRKDSLVILPLRKGARRKADSLSWLISHPAKVNPSRLKKLKLDQMEDEMW